VFDVHLVITTPEGSRFEGLEDALAETPFTVEIEERDDGLLGIWCRGVKSSGVASLPEALRIAQVSLSVPLKHAYPAYADRGGLLWRDVVMAEVIVAP